MVPNQSLARHAYWIHYGISGLCCILSSSTEQATALSTLFAFAALGFSLLGSHRHVESKGLLPSRTLWGLLPVIGWIAIALSNAEGPALVVGLSAHYREFAASGTAGDTPSRAEAKRSPTLRHRSSGQTRTERLKNALPDLPHGEGALVFLVQGSAREPYTVVVERSGHNVTARCNCPAGQFNSLCKHRLAILDGDLSTLASDNADDIRRLDALIAGSDVDEAYRYFRACAESKAWIGRLRDLQPDRRRTSLPTEKASELLASGCFLKDRNIYDADLAYHGSCRNADLPSLKKSLELKPIYLQRGQCHHCAGVLPEHFRRAQDYDQAKKALTAAFRD